MSRSNIKKIGFAMGAIVIGVVVLIMLFLLFFTLTDYSPNNVETIEQSTNSQNLDITNEIKILSWNIGYAGLNKEMDFFYDGGKMVRPTRPQVEKNLTSICSILQTHNDADFILLQELDIDSRRSYHINQLEYFKENLINYHSTFATTYKVLFVPLPISQPMGKVKAGIATFSKITPLKSERYAFPFNFSWPSKIFLLDRCFISTEITTSNNRKLIVINTHNSAFDGTGALPKAELNYLKDYMEKEYKKGNYVLLGGDFNLSPTSLSPDSFDSLYDIENAIAIPEGTFDKEWQIVYDSQIPTNRSTATTYQKGKTKVNCLDFYVASPNIEIKSIQTINLEFESSDHNPVITTIKLVQ